MRLINITILYLLFLTSCGSQDKSNNSDTVDSDKFCENQKVLIGGSIDLMTLDLDLNQTSDEIYEQIKNSFGAADSSSSYIFKIPYNTKEGSIDAVEHDIEFKVIVKKPKEFPGCYLFPMRTFGIDVNKNNQMLIQSEHEGDCQFITEQLSLYYDDTTQGNNQLIWIYWNDSCDKKELEKVFNALIDGYLIAATKYSEELFAKELCELNAEELTKLKDRVPFDLILDLKNLMTPPPPPLPKK